VGSTEAETSVRSVALCFLRLRFFAADYFVSKYWVVEFRSRYLFGPLKCRLAQDLRHCNASFKLQLFVMRQLKSNEVDGVGQAA
jgi:hypothetical protein